MDQNSLDELAKEPNLQVKNGGDDNGLDQRVQQLSDEEWERVEKLTGQNQDDGTVLTREEAIEKILAERK